MDSFARDAEQAIPEALTAAWARAVAAWNDPACHDEVIRLVSQNDAHSWAAARYRERPDDPVSARQLARIRKAAEVTMYASAATRKDAAPKPYRALTAVLIMLIMAAVGGMLYATVMRSGGGEAAPSPPAVDPAPRLPSSR